MPHASQQPFAIQVKQLAKARKLSVSKVGYLAFEMGVRGTSPDTLNKAIQGRGKLNAPLIERVATVLRVPPETFVEYRLAQLRHDLDENEAEVGFEKAAALLQEIEAALRGPDYAAELEQEIDEALEQDAPPSPNTASTARSRGRRRRAR